MELTFVKIVYVFCLQNIRMQFIWTSPILKLNTYGLNDTL